MMAHLMARQNFGPKGELPAAKPPPGVIPNLVNPETIAPRIYTMIAILGFFALMSFSIRIFTRSRILHAFGLDDSALDGPPCVMPGSLP